jgi:hypothetical protein
MAIPVVFDLLVDWIAVADLIADWIDVADLIADSGLIAVAAAVAAVVAAAAAAAACVAVAASKTAGAVQESNLLKMEPDWGQGQDQGRSRVPKWDVAFVEVEVTEPDSPCASLQLKWKQNYSFGLGGVVCNINAHDTIILYSLRIHSIIPIFQMVMFPCPTLLLSHRHWNGIVALVSLHLKITHLVVIYVVVQRPNGDLREIVRLSLQLLF